MSPAALLDELKALGVELWAEGDRLRFSSPKGVLTDEVRSKLRRHKSDLLELLSREEHLTPRSLAPDVVAAPSAATAHRAEPKISLVGNQRLAPPSADEIPRHEHPYARHVAPYRTFLFSQLGLDKHFVRAEGCYLFDEAGDGYLDFVAQFGALPFGFNPPEIWNALFELRARHVPSSVHPGLMDVAGALAERLVKIAPGEMRHVTFANSGTEAVEVALKLARSATGRHGILSTVNAFHGLTLGSMSATGREVFQRGFGAPVPGFDRVPFGDSQAVESALTARPGYYAAFVVEPIQGEGGIVEPRDGYLAAVHEACRSAGTLLVVDEVQTGLGRTGKMFACEHSGVSPEILVLAKALGGGLMPIGACIYNRDVYNVHFELWHSSTFAGNSLACQAGLATLDLLERDNQALVRHAADNGAYLQQRLGELQAHYPTMIAAVRGRGYMMGIELALTPETLGSDLLARLAEQQILLHVIVGYLLNVQKIRVAPAFTGAPVLRIEPPLIAGRNECERFVAAVGELLQILHAGDSGALLGYMIGDAEPRPVVAAKPIEHVATAEDPASQPDTARFAFLVHMLTPADYGNFDPSLQRFSEEQLGELHRRFSHFVDPFPVGIISLESTTGRRAVGELILVPYTAEELMELPGEQALGEVRRAAEVAAERGARIIGLGGFTSVVTQGGQSLVSAQLPGLTNGNSYTVAMAIRAVELACNEHGVALNDANVAIVGAAGIIGRAMSLLLAEQVGHLTLIGNPALQQRSRARLNDVALETVERLVTLAPDSDHAKGATLATKIAELVPSCGRDPAALLAALEADRSVVITTDLDAALPHADVVISATNSVDTLIYASHLKHGAIVCDISRPFNVCRDIRNERPDVLVLEGGMVQITGKADVAALRGSHPNVIPACVAETLLLSLEQQYDYRGLCGALDLDTIRELTRLGLKHAFVPFLG